MGKRQDVVSIFQRREMMFLPQVGREIRPRDETSGGLQAVCEVAKKRLQQRQDGHRREGRCADIVAEYCWRGAAMQQLQIVLA